MRSALLKPSTRLHAGARPVLGARLGVAPKHQNILVIANAAPAEGASGVAVADSPAQATHEHAPVASEPVANGAAPEAGAKNQRKSGKKGERKNDKPSARQVIEARLESLLAGEAVGMSMAATTSDVAVGFRGLRPLSDELRRKQQTLLFFPSTALQQQKQPQQEEAAPADAGAAADAAAPEANGAAAEAGSDAAAASPARNLELALVSVPRFRAPTADVTLRVGARSDVGTMSRMLTRALIQSSAVAIHAAGPGAALVALQAAAAARRNLSSSKQVDLAFTLEYLRVPATTAGPNAAAAAPEAAAAVPEAAAAAAAAAEPAPAAAEAQPAEAGKEGKAEGPMTSILQFSFYKRALPTPEVVVADFAAVRAARPLTQLLVSLLAERREVELVLASRDAVFAMQALARAVRECWATNKASVGVFLTSLETDASVSDADAATPTGLAPAGPGTRPYTARLQLRRIPGAPNLVAASGGGRQRQSLLGAPLGDVKRDTPITGLAAAMNRELDSAGVYSVLPQEGVCVARALLALWEAQRTRGAAYRANAPAAAGTASDASDPEAPPASSLLQIAIVPETQMEGGAAAPAEAPGTQQGGGGGESDQEGGEGGAAGARRRRGAGMRATVLHMVEVTPVLASTLRIKDGAVVPITGGEQLAQLSKAVVLRNRMYGGRRDATALVMTPLLDDAGALAVKMQYVPAARIADLPPPPPPRGTAASEGATEEEALVTAGGEAGAGAVGSGIAATRPSSTGSIAAAAAAAAAARFFSDPSPPAADAFAAGYMTDDEYGIGAEGGAFIPGPMALAEEEAAKPAKAEATPAKAEAKPSVPAAAAGGADSDKPKSPWVLYVSARTASLNLAMSIVAETCKPWDRLSPAWLRVPCKQDILATAGLAVAMAQAQVQERADVTLQVVPVLERRRDERGRPGNYLTWRLIKAGPGAEPGAAAAAAAARASKGAARKSGGRAANSNRNGAAAAGDKDVPVGPSPAAMAAAAAAAAKALADNDKIAKGRLW